MTEFKGRHFGLLLIIFSGWIAVRAAINWPSGAVPKPLSTVIIQPPRDTSASTSTEAVGTVFSDKLMSPVWPRLTLIETKSVPAHRSEVYLEQLSGYSAPASAEATMPLPWAAAAPIRVPIIGKSSSSPKLAIDVYAYGFWRAGESGSRLTTAGQYGGGQSGLIATIGVLNQSGRPMPFTMLVRAAVAHDNIRDREFALGARWKPSSSLPLTISAERRFREAGADNFALYVAGGRSDVPLPAGFKLDTYGQLGILTGQNGGHFFDGQMRAERQILPASPVPLHVGVGIWTGGQKGVARVDIGPTLRTELPVGETRVRINTDWRFRVAGEASPGNGPALTVSTGF